MLQSAVNANLIEQKIDLNSSTVTSPKRLSANEKVERWKNCGCQLALINIIRRFKFSLLSFNL